MLLEMGMGMGKMGGMGCDMGFHYGAHVAVALALLALGMGYLVCAKAHSMECCKKFGKFIGMVIVVISFMLLICLSVLCFKCIGGACHKADKMMLPQGHPPIEAPANPTGK